MVDSDVPTPGADEALCRTILLSIDPANRAWMRMRTYRDQLQAGEVMAGFTLSEVLEPNGSGLERGAIVYSEAGWQEYAALNADTLPTAHEPRERVRHHRHDRVLRAARCRSPAGGRDRPRLGVGRCRRLRRRPDREDQGLSCRRRRRLGREDAAGRRRARVRCGDQPPLAHVRGRSSRCVPGRLRALLRQRGGASAGDGARASRAARPRRVLRRGRPLRRRRDDAAEERSGHPDCQSPADAGLYRARLRQSLWRGVRGSLALDRRGPHQGARGRIEGLDKAPDALVGLLRGANVGKQLVRIAADPA